MPKISVVVRKAYGAGPLRDGRARPSSPTAASPCRPPQIAVMGPEAAINAVFYNQIQAIEDEAERARVRRAPSATEYAADIDILHLASELVVDAVIEPDDLRARADPPLRLCRGKDRRFSERRNPVTPA